MRPWIDMIAEAAQPGIDIDAVRDVARRYDGNPDWTLLDDAVAGARRLAALPVVTIYRVMDLDAAALLALRPGEALGMHWACEPAFDMSNLYVWPLNVLFVGDIAGHEIDPVGTAGINVAFPDEHEIVFKRIPSPVRITGVFALPAHDPIRRDLWGKPFLIAPHR